MTLLSIARTVLAETGWPVASIIATNNDATAQQVFALANTALERLSEDYSWPQLEVEYTIPLVAGTDTYFWPADFRVLSPAPLYDASEYYALKGSMPIADWNIRKYGALANLLPRSYRLVYVLGVPAFKLDSVPSTSGALVATYQSGQYARNGMGGGVANYTSDSDVAKIPEKYVELGLKWRFRRAKGLDFSVELAEYNSTVAAQFAKHVGNGEIPIGGSRVNSVLTSGYVRDKGFGI